MVLFKSVYKRNRKIGIGVIVRDDMRRCWQRCPLEKTTFSNWLLRKPRQSAALRAAVVSRELGMQIVRLESDAL